MAQIQDRKSNFYSHRQSVREESSALQYLESAGDILIKNLARKQAETSTTLREQLEIVQNFEKGTQINPDTQMGISSFKDFKKRAEIDIQIERDSSIMSEGNPDLEELKKKTGLTRHELELSLVEKPNSTISKLYKFALGNVRNKKEAEDLKSKLPDHPINRLKEIEEECFKESSRKKSKLSLEDGEIRDCDNGKMIKEKNNKKKKHRKRRKKCSSNTVHSINSSEEVSASSKNPEKLATEEEPKLFIRPSLWDVKDMKKWANSKQYGCKAQTFYTIKDGKIIKLEKKPISEDIT